MARSSHVSSVIAFVTVAAISIAFSAEVSAHRRDEYLQAARLAIDPDRVLIELDLTAGIAVAESILAEIDLDRDGALSAAETRDYSTRVLRAIAVAIDGRPLGVELLTNDFPTVVAVLKGEGTARVNAVAVMPHVGEGLHHLRFRNAYRSDMSVYLANALVPASDRVTVTAQQRDADQRDLTIDYTLRADAAARTRGGLSVGIAGATILFANVWWRRSRHPRKDLWTHFRIC